jgi:hypothetical protein
MISMDAFRLCDGCNRHVKASAERCPFCDNPCSARASRGPEWSWSGATRATLVAAAMAGCESARPAPAPMAAPPAAEPTVAAIADAAVEVDALVPAPQAAPRLDPAMMAVGYGAPPSDFALEGTVRGRVQVTDVDSESTASNDSERAVSMVLRTQLGGLRACYERGLRNNPTLAGAVSLRFVINASGRVSEMTASGIEAEPAVSACVGARVRGLVFPVPASAPQAVAVNVIADAGDEPA